MICAVQQSKRQCAAQPRVIISSVTPSRVPTNPRNIVTARVFDHADLAHENSTSGAPPCAARRAVPALGIRLAPLGPKSFTRRQAGGELMKSKSISNLTGHRARAF